MLKAPLLTPVSPVFAPEAVSCSTLRGKDRINKIKDGNISPEGAEETEIEVSVVD